MRRQPILWRTSRHCLFKLHWRESFELIRFLHEHSGSAHRPEEIDSTHQQKAAMLDLTAL
jgi:hypothetical protein